MIGTIVIIVGCILMEGFFAGFETGAYCLNRIRLRYRIREGIGSANVVERLLAKPGRLICTTLVGTNIFVCLATLVLTNRLQTEYPVGSTVGFFAGRPELVATLILALPLFIFAEVLPKDLFRRAADSLVYTLARPFLVSVQFLRPLSAPLGLINRLLLKLVPTHPDQLYYSRARLRYFFEESRTEGVLSAYQSAMADNIMRLREINAETVCVPISSVVTLPCDASAEQVHRLAEKLPHRRYPVRDPGTNRIIGVVNVLDLLQDRTGQFSLASHLREPVRIPAQTSVVDALRMLRRTTVPMGLVTDEPGRTIGVLTVKDLVEEIVGELGVW